MTFKSFVETLLGLIDLATPIVFAMAFVATIAGAVVLIAKVGGEEKTNAGKHMLFWGVIFLTVAIGVWAIVRVIQVTFGLR